MVFSTTKKQYGQYFTPDIVADFMIGVADLHAETKILEPSCGEGVFLKLLAQKGYKNIVAYEIDHSLAKAHKGVKYENFVATEIHEKFNLIIGNPPYIRWKNLDDELKKELQTNALWQKHFNGLCDYLYIFILKSIELLAENGQLIFICPEYWMNTTHAAGLRNYMVENGCFESIYHFNETPIFSNAAVSTVIFKYIKSTSKSTNIKVVKCQKRKAISQDLFQQLKDKSDSEEGIEQFEIPAFETNKKWLLIRPAEAATLLKFEQACAKKEQAEGTAYHTIGDICEIGNGMVSGLDKAFQLDNEQLNQYEKSSMIQVVKAKDLRPYTYKKITPYLFVNHIQDEEQLKTDFPTFYQQLKPLEERLNQRYQYNRTINYWEWVFLRNYNLFKSNQPRIFVPCKERISNKNHFRFAYVEAGIFPTQDVTALFLKPDVQESIHYILAFLNHKKVFHWLKTKGIVKGNIVEFSEKPISDIPFRKINWQNKSEIAIHDKITKLTAAYLKKENASALKKIDTLFSKILN